MIELKINLNKMSTAMSGLKSQGVNGISLIKQRLREELNAAFQGILNAEITLFLGREKYERKEERKASNYRNGHHGERAFTLKGLGNLKIRVPRDRQGKFQSKIVPRYKRGDDKFTEELQLLYLAGLSTRKAVEMSKKLFGRSFCATEVSKAARQLTEEMEKWRNRWLNGDKYIYLYIDGVNFHMRQGDSVEIVPVLIVIGVTEDGIRKVIGLQSGDKESASNWRELFKDLKARGLDAKSVQLGIMDGLTGLERVFQEEFPNARIQRCQLHKARNILAKVPRKFRDEIAEDVRSVYYAEDKDTALCNFQELKSKWKSKLPSAVACMEKDLEATLAFMDFPKAHWLSLRTTNLIERLNKEFKRRTKVMEILAGENSCYRLLFYISMRMEKSWRRASLGRVGIEIGPKLRKRLKAA